MIDIFYKYNNKILTFTIPSNLSPITRNTHIQEYVSRAFVRRIGCAAAGNGTSSYRYGNARNCCSGGTQDLPLKSMC